MGHWSVYERCSLRTLSNTSDCQTSALSASYFICCRKWSCCDKVGKKGLLSVSPSGVSGMGSVNDDSAVIIFCALKLVSDPDSPQAYDRGVTKARKGEVS